MKALSVRQPWAWLVCKGYKDIENRVWHLRMPPLLNYPKTPRRIYVHTGLIMDVNAPDRSAANEWILERLTTEQREEYENAEIHRGAIIGEVDIMGCCEHSKSPWFTGPFGFVLANPELYDHPIPCKGRLGFFEPNFEDEIWGLMAAFMLRLLMPLVQYHSLQKPLPQKRGTATNKNARIRGLHKGNGF